MYIPHAVLSSDDIIRRYESHWTFAMNKFCILEFASMNLLYRRDESPLGAETYLIPALLFGKYIHINDNVSTCENP